MDYIDYSDNSDDTGSSGLADAIFGAVGQVGSAALLSQNNPNIGVPYPQPTSSFGYSPQNYGKSNGNMTLFIVVILLVLGYFAFGKMK